MRLRCLSFLDEVLHRGDLFFFQLQVFYEFMGTVKISLCVSVDMASTCVMTSDE